MRFEKKELGGKLTQYRLLGEKNKNERLALYNDILFHNIGSLYGKNRKSIIIINELTTGGIILSDNKNIDRIFNNLSSIYKKYNNINFKKGKKITSSDKKVIKLIFFKN